MNKPLLYAIGAMVAVTFIVVGYSSQPKSAAMNNTNTILVAHDLLATDTPSILTPKLESLGIQRGLTLQPLTMADNKVHIAGQLADVRFMTEIVIVLYKVGGDVNTESQREYRTSLSSEGSFASDVPLGMGIGSYSLTIQAPLLQPHEVDDISHAPLASFNVNRPY